METVVVEIRAAEGGDDAKLLVGEMTLIYEKASLVNKFTFERKH